MSWKLDTRGQAGRAGGVQWEGEQKSATTMGKKKKRRLARAGEVHTTSVCCHSGTTTTRQLRVAWERDNAHVSSELCCELGLEVGIVAAAAEDLVLEHRDLKARANQAEAKRGESGGHGVGSQAPKPSSVKPGHEACMHRGGGTPSRARHVTDTACEGQGRHGHSTVTVTAQSQQAMHMGT